MPCQFRQRGMAGGWMRQEGGARTNAGLMPRRGRDWEGCSSGESMRGCVGGWGPTHPGRDSEHRGGTGE